ncbi:MAG: hypothetical protein HF967_05090, partial [Methanosarcinales archaeon]|nr:hypothetical protein [Methanosarcinales archaeon]
MITREDIYALALQDARTGDIPVKDSNGNTIMNRGQNIILGDKDNEKLRTLSSDLAIQKKLRADAFDQMLGQNTPLGKSVNITDTNIKKLENEIATLTASIELAKEDITEEEERQVTKGFDLPEKPSKFKEVGIDEEVKDSFIDKLKSQWKGIRKWLGVFFVIALIEVFFGLALFESMREQKSLIQVFLRIASSAVLVITLHLGERKYKENGAKVFAGYIVFGIILLVVLLFGSLVLGYLYPEYLNDGNLSTNVFDLTDTDVMQEETVNRGFTGLFLKYDFFIGIIGLIAYMLISFLDKSKKNEEVDENFVAESSNMVTDNYGPTGAILNRMYSNIMEDENRLSKIEFQLKELKNDASPLLEKIEGIMTAAKSQIKEIDVK